MRKSLTPITAKIRAFISELLSEHNPDFKSMVSAQTLPLVLPEIPQDLNSGDSGLNMLLCAERLISHYGSFDLTGPDTCKPKKTNEIFSFFQFSENAANELRSEILRVMNMLSGESENRYAEFAGFDADDINFDLL